MNGGSLVPANAKKSMLIAGFLRPMPDLAILLTGVAITTILLLVLDSNRFVIAVLSCIPALICVFLILPIPKYHNMMCFLTDFFKFYFERRIYKWKGWCVSDEFKD